MYNLQTEQKVYDIGGVKIGGIPGENPTVLIGSLFYRRSGIVEDEDRGIFDKKAAEELILRQEELSDVTGNPALLDVEGPTSTALEKYIEFVADKTDAPLLIGGPTPEVREAGLRKAQENGLEGRMIYNSLMPGCSEKELESILNFGVESAVLLGYSFSNIKPHGRVDALKDLLNLTNEKGLKKTLLDTFVMDIPSLGIAFKSLMEVKSSLGYPAGCGPHNAIGMWKGLRKKMKIRTNRPVVASVNSFATASGADFLLYGPIETAEAVFPAVAMVDAAYGFNAIQQGIRLDRAHPLFKIA